MEDKFDSESIQLYCSVQFSMENIYVFTNSQLERHMA